MKDVTIEECKRALKFVQIVLGDHRDGIYEHKHPDFNHTLCLEEVKYCVVDPLLEKLGDNP